MEKILTYIVFTPLLFAFVMGIFRVNIKILRVGAILSSVIVFVLTVTMIAYFDPYQNQIQFERSLPWIASYGIYYHIGVDVLSLVIISITSLLIPILYIYMWQNRYSGYWYNMMLLQTGVMGAVVSLDLILFYMFWETMLLPVFIMIGRYGHDKNRLHAMKILLMTVFGSMAMLFSILYLGYEYFVVHSYWSFELNNLALLHFDPKTTLWLSAGFMLAFAIKIPLVGFHTWMAPAYSSAPTPALVILSAVMAKLGAYGIWRFGYGLFSETMSYYRPYIIIFAITGMLYYAVRAMSERDLRRMFAFSSGSHLSVIVLGIIIANIYSWGGSLYFIATHALSSAGIFIMIGLIYRRVGSVDITTLGGIAKVAPKFAFIFAFFALSIVGLPSTGGFVAELLIIIGAFKSSMSLGFVTAFSMISAILYIFYMLQQTIYGPLTPKTQEFGDLTTGEISMLLPLVVLLLVSGIFPSAFIPALEPQLQHTLQIIGGTL